MVATEAPGARTSDYALAALPVMMGALALYMSTLLPDVGVWDTAEFQALGPVLGTAHPTGYPTYTLLLWLASVVLQPLGNEAYRADLLSALLMAGASALLAVRVVMATRRWALGLATGVVFALTPVAWTWGLRADPHALHVFVAALLLVLLGVWQARERRATGDGARWLLAAAVVYGLALGNHALTLLLAPGIAVFVLLVAPRILRRQWRLVLACAAGLLLAAASVYLYLPLRSAMDPPLDYADPQTWERFWYVVLGEQFQGSFGPLPGLAELLGGVWDELVRNLGLLAILALAGALLGLLRHPRLTVLGAALVRGHLALRHGLPQRRHRALLPGAPADGCAGGGARGRRGLGRRCATCWSEAVTRSATAWPRAPSCCLLLGLTVVPALDRRDAIDAATTAGAGRSSKSTFEVLEPEAVVISWWSFSTPLWYGQHVEGRRPDVTVIDDRDILDDGYGDVSRCHRGPPR